MKQHHMAQLMVTVAIALTTGAHYLLQFFAPTWLWVSPAFGFGASLLWVWVDDLPFIHKLEEEFQHEHEQRRTINLHRPLASNSIMAVNEQGAEGA